MPPKTTSRPVNDPGELKGPDGKSIHIARRAGEEIHWEYDLFDDNNPPANIQLFRNLGAEFDKLYNRIVKFTKEHFKGDLHKDVINDPGRIFYHLNHAPDLTRIAGCIAVGGDNGKDGWIELFEDEELRQHMVAGIIWRALREHVFAALLFGGTKHQWKRLLDMEQEEIRSEGFWRTQKRSNIVRNTLSDEPDDQDEDNQKWIKNPLEGKAVGEVSKSKEQAFKKYRDVPLQPGVEKAYHKHVPADLQEKSQDLALSIYHLLKPILGLIDFTWQRPSSLAGRIKAGCIDKANNIVEELFNIVAEAAKISIRMRLDGDTVYYFLPSGKDDYFAKDKMVMVNEQSMQEGNLQIQDEAASGHDAEQKKRLGYMALVRIIVMDGLTSYQQFGWKDSHEHMKGFRTYDVLLPKVACRWGNQRKFNDKATEEDRKYVELKDAVEEGYP